RERLLYDTGEKHILSLLRAADGSLLAGSADQAILYKITPNGKNVSVQALRDFDGEEVRAISRRGNTLFVAVNEFQRSGSAAPPPPPTRAGKASSNTPLPSARDRKGRGAVYRIDPDGRVEQLHVLGDGYFTALSADSDGNVWAAAGANGRVYL